MMPQHFPVTNGVLTMPNVPSRFGSLSLTNNAANGQASVTVTELATGRIVYQATIPPKSQASLSGMNGTDLIPGGQYQCVVTGSVTGLFSTDDGG